MPRRQFVADLRKAQAEVLPQTITDLCSGDDDGQFQFAFTPATYAAISQVSSVQITAIIPELGDYPNSHEYMLFAEDAAPAHISEALQNIRGTSSKTVYELVEIVAASLQRSAPDQDGDSQMTDLEYAGQSDEEVIDHEDFEDDVYDSDHEAFFDDTQPRQAEYGVEQTAVGESTPNTSTSASRTRLRADFRAVKAAGFRVGILTRNIVNGSAAYVTISSRIAKLGISPEAMQAWQIEPTEYIMMILRYPAGYRTYQELAQISPARLPTYFGVRVVAGKHYKATLLEAIKCFATATEQEAHNPSQEDNPEDHSTVRETFISKPLSRLLEESLMSILKFRSVALPWHGAESWLADHLSGAQDCVSNPDRIPAQYYEAEQERSTLPAVLTADHFTEQPPDSHSLPLLAMQFMLRHFVRCTEFCLVCHRKLDSNLEAIKPYVCDRSLCLYQYMSLGFGPSIEHEILAQPFVVDLLVSFCYSSALSQRMKLFPDGLSLVVPPSNYSQIDEPIDLRHKTHASAPHGMNPLDPSPRYAVGFNEAVRELLFWDTSEKCPVRRGSWIALTLEDSALEHHCRVKDASMYPTIYLDEIVSIKKIISGTEADQYDTFESPISGKSAASQPASQAARSGSNWTPAEFRIYNQDYNELKLMGKMEAMCRILELLPSVTAMQEYIRKGRELRSWVERIPPCALNLLRWIVASNRACIMQVDTAYKSGQDERKVITSDRVSGMPDMLQFRFAMGAPDKEQRFLDEVHKTQQRLNLAYPTIFAWHGSPLWNWHMIVREGLHFKDVANGRAYGNGIYHAKDASTSTGYSGMRYGQAPSWSNSILKISSALALSEIVNAPQEFASNNPYYVVQHLDWVQTRYLFVKCAADESLLKMMEWDEHMPPANPHPQDPLRTPLGSRGEKIAIPASAIRSSKAVLANNGSRGDDLVTKKQKLSLPGATLARGYDRGQAGEHPDSDTDSVATEGEDLEFLLDDEADLHASAKSFPVASIEKSNGSVTDFVPKSLDFAGLPLLPLPTYATSSTTRALMKEIQTLAKIQENSSLAELGWYIDVEKIENVYQWIIELHSFHMLSASNGKELPLAADMRAQKLTSIVLEVRFNRDFPFTPPYVRVIRPRFLSLMQGGGGHIVQGGALCMELLTNTGWSGVSSMESVLLQIRLAIASEPFARLAKNSATCMDYHAGEAAEGYIRACQNHGWAVPDGFREMAYTPGTIARDQSE